MARTFYFSDLGELDAAPPGSVLVMYVEGEAIGRLQTDGVWSVEQIVKDVDGREAAAILRKQR
ncbi:MAG: hypothetical protein ABI039_10380 [Vicinamibacterales bacterium]